MEIGDVVMKISCQLNVHVKAKHKIQPKYV